MKNYHFFGFVQGTSFDTSLFGLLCLWRKYCWTAFIMLNTFGAGGRYIRISKSHIEPTLIHIFTHHFVTP